MNKEIIIEEQIFKFEYIKEHKIWYLGYNEFDFLKIGHDVDITIEEAEPNWIRIELFLNFILNDIIRFKKLIEYSNLKLEELFNDIFGGIETGVNNIFFTLSNITYIKQPQNTECFEYILDFNIGSETNRDFFMYETWNALVKDYELENVSKS
ncbi:hypothetical protein [Dysgonomonas sp. 25]|uniref:hypothetical protein n=1 Tax=Dysgonomonas sp. 25 TaxID=2302933 RepID=UPI0013D4A25C|nr:hypothetical protein [Dysgonomonas sp. 25]NDV70036.1 hypothetical protein [Dysgonomonas sp. 25]